MLPVMVSKTRFKQGHVGIVKGSGLAREAILRG